MIAVCSLLLAPQSAAAPPTPGTAGEPDTVDTLAGPAFCDGAARVDPESVVVRAVTVDRSGTVSALAGIPGDDVLARLGGADSLRIYQLPGITEGADGRSSGVMASDGSGEVFLSKGTSIAHIGAPLPPGDPTLTARFIGIRALASDESGNLYVADDLEPGEPAVAIRFVNRGEAPVTFYGGTGFEIVAGPRTVATIAGVAGDADGGDGGPALRATIAGGAISMALAPGLLYVGAFEPGAGPAGAHGRVRAVNLGAGPATAVGVPLEAGRIETVAGGGRTNQTGEGTKATVADFGTLPGMAADGDGNLFLAEESRHRIRKVDRSGTTTTVAGTGTTRGAAGERPGGGFNGNNRPATEARLDQPVDVEISPGGVMYIADKGNGLVRTVDKSGTIRAVIGSGLALSSTCRPESAAVPPAETAALAPTDPVAAADGSVYFLASAVGRVMRLDPSGTVEPLTDPLTGCLGTSPCERAGGRPRVARPTGLALGGNGGLYILDGGDNRVVVLNVGDGTLTAHGVRVKPGELKTVAGTGTIGSSGDGAPATEGQINGARSIAVDAEGNLFIADTGNGAVRQVDVDGTITTLVPAAPAGEDACCRRPLAVAAGPDDNLYVVEGGGGVWLLNRGVQDVVVHGQGIPPGTAKLVAGGGGYGVGGEGGPAITGQFQDVTGIAWDGKGSLFVADQPASVRRVDAAGNLTTVAGLGSPSFNGDGLRGRLTGLRRPASVAVDRCGNLLIADSGNDRLRRLNLAVSCPPLATGGSGLGGLRTWLLVPAFGIVAAIGAVSWRRRQARRAA